ncbi:MAG: adenosylmethionine decarboxylase [Desulfosarcinaceae bacterium]|nr:adenosylmethionine decarboxylase [Desulfosarcinaceae bacterium]
MYNDALLDTPAAATLPETAGAAAWPQHHNLSAEQLANDHFIQRDGITFAGTHLIIDLWGADGLEELERMERALRDCVAAARATLLHIHLHHFTPSYGISGVAVLAESHISVHTWPERNYAAFDIFMCGDAQPHKAVAVLEAAFAPTRSKVTEIRRGVVGHE